jgi:hypothetical protein
MKHLIVISILTASSLTTQAADFQKVYEVPLAENAIKKAANITRDRAVITCTFWGVGNNFVGEVILEAKDGRYRLTFDNMTSVDSGALLSSLPQTQESCNKAMNAYGDKLYTKISNWSDF